MEGPTLKEGTMAAGMPKKNVVLQYNAISLLSFGAIMAGFTFVPIFLRESNVSDFEIGLVAIGYALLASVSSWVFGRASDITGRRKSFIQIGLATSAVSFLFQIFGDSFLIMLLARGLLGFSVGIFPPALMAYAYEQGQGEGRMGRFASFGALGWGVGALGGSIIAELINLEAVFIFGAILFFFAFLVAHFYLPAGVNLKIESNSGTTLKVLRENSAIYIVILIRHSSAFAIWTFWPLFLLEIGATLIEVGIIQFTNMTVQFFVMQALGKYAHLFENQDLIVIGLSLSALVFGLFALLPYLWTVLILQALLATAWSTLYVGSLKSVTETSEERSTATGLLRSVLSICAFIGPIVGTGLILLFEEYTITMVYAMVMTILALFTYFILTIATNPEKASTNEFEL